MTTMQMMAWAVLGAWCAFADFVRGGYKPRPWVRPWMRHPVMLVYGAVLGVGLQLDPVGIAVVSLVWWTGEWPGWGFCLGRAVLGPERHEMEHPMAAPEWWQPEWTWNHEWLACAMRGALWGIPLWGIMKYRDRFFLADSLTLLVTYTATIAMWAMWPVTFALAVAGATGMVVGAAASRWLLPDDGWHLGEIVRGVVVFSVVAAAGMWVQP